MLVAHLHRWENQMSTVKIEVKPPVMQQIVVGYKIGESLNMYGYFITPS